MNIYLVIFITLIAALIASVAQLLFKKGVPEKLEKKRHIIGLFKNRYILLGGVTYLISFPVYIYALSAAPLSVVYPVFASTFIFVTLISVLTFKEKLSTLRALGVFLVFIGVVIIGLSAG